VGRRTSLLVKGKGVFRVGLVINRWKCFGKAELSFSHSHTQNKQPCHTLNTHLPLNFHLVATMCTLPSDPFIEPFYSPKKAFTRLLSLVPESADGTSINIACPSSAPPILITQSLTIHTANIAMLVTSKIFINPPAPK